MADTPITPNPDLDLTATPAVTAPDGWPVPVLTPWRDRRSDTLSVTSGGGSQDVAPQIIAVKFDGTSFREVPAVQQVTQDEGNAV